MPTTRPRHDPSPPPGASVETPPRPGSASVTVIDRSEDNARPPLRVSSASVSLYHTDDPPQGKPARPPTEPARDDYVDTKTTGNDGVVRFDDLDRGWYAAYLHHNRRYAAPVVFNIYEGCIADVDLNFGVGFVVAQRVLSGDCQPPTFTITWPMAGGVMAAVFVAIVGAAMWTMRKRDIT